MAITFSQSQVWQLADQHFERRLAGVLANTDPQAAEAFATPDALTMREPSASCRAKNSVALRAIEYG